MIDRLVVDAHTKYKDLSKYVRPLFLETNSSKSGDESYEISE